MSTAREIERLRLITRVMDEALRIPGTRLRFGLDGLLGLLPGAGDAVTAAISGYALLAAARTGASRALLARMAGNILLDAAVGAIPLLGDVFDFGFKANRRNLNLLEQHAADPVRTRKSSRLAIAGAVGLLALVLVGAVTLAVFVARAVFSLFT